MPRISAISLDQINRQFDVLDDLTKQVAALQKQLSFTTQRALVNDPSHAPQTTNNLTFTWTGSTGVLSWLQGYIKDKNWSAQTSSRPAIRSSAPGQQHTFPVAAGSLVLNPSTYYWLGWDYSHNKMRATTVADDLHNQLNIHVICQIYTGTSGETGAAGGGGSTGGVDLSGLRYKNF